MADQFEETRTAADLLRKAASAMPGMHVLTSELRVIELTSGKAALIVGDVVAPDHFVILTEEEQRLLAATLTRLGNRDHG
jgi:hypothetical protein